MTFILLFELFNNKSRGFVWTYFSDEYNKTTTQVKSTISCDPPMPDI
ncbi:MAG: hypothetical protein ACXVCN_06250 [Bdellovibrio sp.]